MDLISELYGKHMQVYARLLRILAADEEKHESREKAPQWKMLKMLTKNKEVRFFSFSYCVVTIPIFRLSNATLTDVSLFRTLHKHGNKL